MNAYELADDLDALFTKADWEEIPNVVAMLRQQADRIAELEKIVSFCEDRMFKLEYKNTHPVKQLSDEEIMAELVKVKHTWVATTSVWFEFEKTELIKAIRAIIKEITE